MGLDGGVSETVNGVTRIFPIQKVGKYTAKNILGVQPFIMFGEPGQYLYMPAKNFSAQGLIGNKMESRIVEDNIAAQKADATKATTLFNQKLGDPVYLKLKEKNDYQGVNDYINNLYLNGQ